MPETGTTLEVRRVDDRSAIIAVRGELTGATEAALMDAYGRAADPSTRLVVLDFGELDYMNSTGLALIVQLLARGRAERCEVHAFGLSDHYREIFQITRLADFVTLHGDRAAALA